MDFNDRCAFPDALDAHKRVRYSHGLVLGVGELRTEQHFMLGLHYSHNRRLHGYGTGAGLRLEIRYLADGPECLVHPGWGVDSHGHDICVHEAQCARINQWLAQQQARGDLSSPLDTSGVAGVEAFVVLCYHECETDKVPIPVGPCLSLDTSMAPSRIEQSFSLQLLRHAPPQPEEDAIRRLGDILSRITIAPAGGGLTTADEIVAEIRSLVAPPHAPDSIPSIPSDFALDPAYAEEIVATALRIFVTEVRPLLVRDGGPCLNGPRDETCLLLGRLVFDVTPGTSGPEVVPGSIVIDERRRPLLFPTRLLQEGMLANLLPGAAGTAPIAPLIVVPPGPLAALSTPRPGMTLIPLLPSSASPSTLASTAGFAGGIPSLQFSADSTATFTFTVPPGLSPTAPVALRLHWAFSRPDRSREIAASWEMSLRLQSSNTDLPPSAPAPGAFIDATTASELNRRLVTTEFVDLPRGTSTNPVLGFLSLTLRAPAPLPRTHEIHLLLAELEFDTRARS